MISNLELKKVIRKEILSIRKKMTESEVSDLSKLICESIIKTDIFKACQNICIYSPINNEVDVFYLIEDCLLNNKSIYLPKTLEEDIEFYKFTSKNELTVGRYNILEPVSDIKLIPDSNTLIIMPGSVFSISKDRIGYGGGYYDRYLSNYPMCKTLAVAYDFQVLPSIPIESHDQKTDTIITDCRII